MIVEAAGRAFASTPGIPPGLRPGRPAPVHAPDGELTYWVVPGLIDGRLAAIARVLADGRIATTAAISPPRDGGADEMAAVLTGLGAGEARLVVEAIAGERRGGEVSEPILVHDGYVGREAWLAILTSADRPAEWVFATGGGTYLRARGVGSNAAGPDIIG